MSRLTPEEVTEKYVRNSLKAYIESDKLHQNWIIGIIEKTEIRGQRLEDIFNRLEEYPRNRDEKVRLQQAYERCQDEGWLTK